MAVVSFDKKELEGLVGKKLSDDSLKNKVPMMGCDLERINGKKVEYEIFPDRPDLLSIEGFARSLRYFLGVSEGLEGYEAGEGAIELKVDESVKSVRPCVGAGVVRNLKLTDEVLRSLMQVQEKIHATFGRERKKVSIGIHDLRRVEAPFTYKAVKPETVEFVPLQAQEKMNLREIKKKHPKGKYVEIIEDSEKWPVIVDKSNGVLSFPPVINGTLTQLTEKTENVFIDVTGTDEKAVNQALNLIVTELAERGGKIERVDVEGVVKPDLEPEGREVNLDYVNKLLDQDLTEGEFAELAKGMGFGYSEGKVLIPPYRVDVMHPIDVVEDVAIRHGYENFEPRIPDVPGIGNPDDLEEFAEKIRQLIIGFGFQEVKTPVLTNKTRQFERMEMKEEEVVETKNPLSEKYSIGRKYLLPELMGVLEENKHRSYPQKIFEIGNVLKLDGNSETGARNAKKFAAAISNDKVNYTDLASILDSMFDLLKVEYELKEMESNFFIESRCAKLFVGEKETGIMGEIHPQVLENWKLEKPVVAFELNLEKLKAESSS